MKKGDRAVFYHSNAKPPAAVGIVEVIKEAYPDHFGWKEGHKYQDAKASPEKPIWSMVDVKLIQIFSQEISLEQLRGVKALEGLELLRRGSRLSVHPVTAAHFKVFERLAKQK
jgi:predicted RNA-binding protein with PUA-like domain